ncbi:MAG: hypothetical protein E7379_00085 [Clostridiales bacterium]|nr:hypothetical protein [Clostridiales bacterium]
MTFVFDLDDTVCDTDDYSQKYIWNFIKEHNLPFHKTNANTRFAEGKFDWSKKIALTWYKIYGDEMMLEFPCKKGAVDFINSLFDNGHKIVIATARATDWHTTPVLVTKLWLAKNKIKYHKLYTGRIDKEKICEIEQADFFFDDDLKITANVATHFKNHSHPCQALLATTEFNKDLQPGEGVQRILDFNHYKHYINDLLCSEDFANK